MNKSTTTRLLCAIAALVTSLSLLSGVAALGGPEPAPTQLAQAPARSVAALEVPQQSAPHAGALRDHRLPQARAMQVPMTERLARQVGLKRVAVTVFVRGIGLSHVVCVARHVKAKPPVTQTLR